MAETKTKQENPGPAVDVDYLVAKLATVTAQRDSFVQQLTEAQVQNKRLGDLYNNQVERIALLEEQLKEQEPETSDE